MTDSRILTLLSVLGLCLMLTIVWRVRGAGEGRLSDFAAFYAGARLLGTDYLYDPERLQQMELAHAGKYSPDHGYLRPPFHALLVWPLTRFSYGAAEVVWNVLLAAALAGFVTLWRPPQPSVTLLATCFSVPAFFSFVNGQDVPFLLLYLAAAVHLHNQGRTFTAGAIFSLCAVKFHLFLLAPLWIIGQRAWSFGKGVVAGGAVLSLASFAAAGWSWPVEWFESARQSDFSPHPGLMPNLHGVFSSLSAGWLEGFAALVVAVCVWIVSRRSSFQLSLACALAGGLLVSYHAYLPDLALLLPAALVAASEGKSGILRVLAVILLLPPAAFLVVLDFPASGLLVAAVFAFLCLMAYEAWRGPEAEAVG